MPWTQFNVDLTGVATAALYGAARALVGVAEAIRAAGEECGAEALQDAAADLRQVARALEDSDDGHRGFQREEGPGGP